MAIHILRPRRKRRRCTWRKVLSFMGTVSIFIGLLIIYGLFKFITID